MTSSDQPRVTTTHTGATERVTGRPRLVLKAEDLWSGEEQPVFWLTRTMTTLGSHASCDIVLPAIEALHAVVSQDDADEYVLESCGPETRVHGAVVLEPTILRTGSRIELGSHSLAYFREEYADHGRPFGGRTGGEFGHQRNQPRRSEQERTTGR